MFTGQQQKKETEYKIWMNFTTVYSEGEGESYIARMEIQNSKCRIINTSHKLTAQTELFVRVVPAVVGAVAHPALAHTQVVRALELILRAPATSGVSRSCRRGGNIHIITDHSFICLPRLCNLTAAWGQLRYTAQVSTAIQRTGVVMLLKC